jgi:hypothetical protein
MPGYAYANSQYLALTAFTLLLGLATCVIRVTISRFQNSDELLELTCRRCGGEKVSLYYFRAPSLCSECFDRLPRDEKQRVESAFPHAPYIQRERPATSANCRDEFHAPR